MSRKSKYSSSSSSHCYTALPLSKTVRVQQNSIQLFGWKGCVLVNLMPADLQTTNCAWLYGEDFDRLIAALQEARRAWKKSYLTTQRVLAKEKKAKHRGAK